MFQCFIMYQDCCISACGYANGSLTPEQAVLIAYARGYSSKKIQNPVKGLMASVGLSEKQILNILPQGVFVGCQNSSSNVTISGPENITKNFIEELKSRAIFVKEVNTGNIAYHSRYIHEAKPYFREFVQKILNNPKPRSPKWISTSVPANQEQETWANLDCIEYHLNNFCNTVLFDQIYEHIPPNAIVVEIGPHGLLQAILKRQLPPSVINIPLTNKRSPNPEQFFLSSIGK